MADWTTLDLNGLLPGEPWTSNKALAVYENPIAISEGATGAPRILLPALENPAPGATIRSRRDGTVTATASDATALSFAFIQIGEVRVTLNVVGGVGVAIKRLRNSTTSTLVNYTSSGAKSLDVEVLPGDLLSIVAQGDGADPGSVSLSRIQTNGENLWPGNSVRLENTYA